MTSTEKYSLHSMRSKVLPGLLLGFSFLLPSLLSAQVLTSQYDNARTGATLTEKILTPANVNSSQFGKLFTLKVDGDVYAQPLYLPNIEIPGKGKHNILFIATENDSVYAFDADTGAQLWKVSVLGNGETPSDTRNCGQITPQIGITSSPVIDRASGPNGIRASGPLPSRESRCAAS